MRNFNEIGKSTVCFHIGRGGRFWNPGHKTYNSYVKSFGELVNQDWVFVNNEDENGNTLDDEDWTLTDCNGNVLLEGRKEICSETGTLPKDGLYDSDIVKRLEDCDEEEIELVYNEGFHHTLTNEDLLAYCCWRMDKKMIDSVDFNGRTSCNVKFMDGTSDTITFAKDSDIYETIDDFFTDNDIDEKSREKWFDEIELRYNDCFERFIIYRDSEDLRDGWVCTDRENGITCRFKAHKFNETQNITMDNEIADVMFVARLMREMGDWLGENHREIVF